MRPSTTKAAVLALAVFWLTSCTSLAPISPEVRNQLAPSGKIRAAINYGNPALATRQPSGELRGVTIQLSRELGRRLDVPMELVAYDTVAKLLAGLKAGEWDVAFLAVDPARVGDVAFTAPYMEVELTYLVPNRSALASVTEVDRPGIRIAVQAKNAADLFLTRELKHASLIRASNESAAFDSLKAGAVEAYATNLQAFQLFIDKNPGYRAVHGRFATIPHAVGVPSSRTLAADYLRRFIEDVKASGFVGRALDESGTRGVVVAP